MDIYKVIFNVNILLGFLIINVDSILAQEHRIAILEDTITYCRHGSGDTTLLFLHGWGLEKEVWNYQVPAFQQKFTVIALDFPGFGASTALRDKYTMESYSIDLKLFIRQLGLNNVILISHSMAANIAILYAADKPKELLGIIGIDVFKDVQDHVSEEMKGEEEMFLELLKSDFNLFSREFANQVLMGPSMNKDNREYIFKTFNKMKSHSGISSLHDAFKIAGEEQGLLAKMSFKLYLINSISPPTNLSRLEEICRNGIVLLEMFDVSHYPMIEAPTIFNTCLEKHIHSILLLSN